MKKLTDLKDYLEEKTAFYNNPGFITHDPISIPRRFSNPQDIEISGFLSASIAWGQRPVILKNATALLQRMDFAPHQFILNFTGKDLIPFRSFVHRTFNGTDCIFFMKSLQNIYRKKKSLQYFFDTHNTHSKDLRQNINDLRNFFFSIPGEPRTGKHFANPDRGSAAKRINMFLRWMIRKDIAGVDFGIWNISPSILTCPLDVHSGRIARHLGLLQRSQNDWQAATELTENLRRFDPADPVKYDFALFGIGVSEKF